MKINLTRPCRFSASLIPHFLGLCLAGLPLSELAAVPMQPADPDVLVGRNASGPFIGDDINNTTAAGQKLVRQTTSKAIRTWFEIQSDDQSIPSFLTITATAGNRDFRTRYFFNGANVTAAITAEGILALVGESLTRQVLQQVKPTRRIRKKTRTRTHLVSARSTSPPDVDTAASVIRKKRRR